MARRRGRAARGATPPLQPRNALTTLAFSASLGAAAAPDPAGVRTLSPVARGLPDENTGEHPRELPCEEPVRRARVEFPRHLLLGPADDSTVMYSGYVNVTKEDYLFYWFVEAQPGASLDAPIIVWSNGGPGCSAMEGVTTENGPLILYGFRKHLAGRLSRNPYSWNRHAHVLYVDQPRYVGFSMGTGPFTRSSREAGLDMVQFLRGWRGLFPEHASRGVVLAAESYGGHYAPAWGAAILDHNRHASDPIRLDGIAIGNGAVDEKVQDATFAEFVQREGLVLDGLPDFDLAPPNWGELMGRVASNLGYVPNYYDYRVMEEECCGCSSYNYKAWSDWLLRDDVTKALNVCGQAGVKAFADCNAGCIEIPGFDKNDSFNAREALGDALRAGVKVTMYYGMTDTVCNYVGGAMLAHSLEWPGSSSFAAEPLKDLIINGATSGKTKAHGGLTWIQVEGAGHMVPIDNPAAAFHAIRTLMPESTDGCEGSLLDVSNFIRESERVDVGEAAGRLGPAPARAAAALLAACAACAAGLLLIGGRALAAACRGRGRLGGGFESPRLHSSPLGDRSPVHSRTPIHMRSPEYVLAPTASSVAPNQLVDQGRSLAGWLDA